MPRGAPPSAWIGARPNKPASGGEAKGRPSSPDSASYSESSAPEGTSSGKAVEEENHSPASGGDTQIAQPVMVASSPDSASKSESSQPVMVSLSPSSESSEGTSSGKEDSNSEKHTSGSEVAQEEVDYGGSSSSSSGEAEEQKENQQQCRPLAAQAEETEGEEEKEEEEEQEEEEESKDLSTEEEESGEAKEKRIGPPFKPPPRAELRARRAQLKPRARAQRKRVLAGARYSKAAHGAKKRKLDFEEVDEAVYTDYEDWEVWNSTDLMSKEGIADFTRRNWQAIEHIMMHRATYNKLVQDLPPDPSYMLASGSASDPSSALASGSASYRAPRDPWEYVKDVFQRHKGEVREKEGVWIPIRGKSLLEEHGLWHPQFAFTEATANALASGSDPAKVCRPTRDGRINLMARLSLPKDYKKAGHDPDGEGHDCRPLAANLQDIDKYYVRSAKVFGLGDLFKHLGDVATGKELHDIWLTCRIAANKRLHSGRARGKGDKGGKGKKKEAKTAKENTEERETKEKKAKAPRAKQNRRLATGSRER